VVEPGRGNGFTARFPREYHPIHGVNNNERYPAVGAAQTPLVRIAPSAYEDGIEAPAGASRPGPREVSNAVCAQSERQPNSANASDMLWQWGQFLDHDIDETPASNPPESFDIPVPAGDPFFNPFNTGTQVIALNRSEAVYDGDGVRQQINVITSYIDASNVYGSEDERAEALRTHDGTGFLKTSPSPHGPLLPFNEEGLPNAGGPGANLFLAGDVRANEQVALLCMHTLFVREHNFWARLFARRDPSLEGDELYELARIVVAAEMQAITYREFLPLLLGKGALEPYRGYDSEIDPGISNLFATAAYRVGHTMLSADLPRLKRDGSSIEEGPLALKDAFFRPTEVSENGIEVFLRSLVNQSAQEIDTRITDAVRNFLFGPPGAGGFDLASLNIQRGRDHGLPGYKAIREKCGLPRIASFDDYPEVEPGLAEVLEDLYGTPDEMDPWIGLLGEAHVEGALVGETLRAVLADQFRRLRDGDRFWYQNYLNRGLQKLIERQTLARIIRRSTRIGNELPADVFRVHRDDDGKGKGKRKGRGKSKGKDRLVQSRRRR